jgi:acetylornithine aminotransferase
MSYLMSNYAPLEVSFIKGSGCYLTDDKEDLYLDAISGVGVVGLGHCHPKITKILQTQAAQLLHTSNWYKIPHQEALAKKLTQLSEMDKVFFANSGAEANEAAIKITRLYAKNKGIKNPIILTAHKSFHGRTLATLSATGNANVQTGFHPLVESFIQVDFNQIKALEAYANNPNVIGIMLEPIQGESGIIIPDKNYLNQVQALCQAQDWLFILDEVQTGIGRTGKWFAHQYNKLVPDILTLAKGLGNGIPIGACLAKGKASTLFTPGTHGSTFGGNPLACKVALGVLSIIENDSLLQHCQQISAYIVSTLNHSLSKLPQVLEIRAKGLMIAIELSGEINHLLNKALKEKLLINVTGQSIRLLPPLIINYQEADILMSKLTNLIKEL